MERSNGAGASPNHSPGSAQSPGSGIPPVRLDLVPPHGSNGAEPAQTPRPSANGAASDVASNIRPPSATKMTPRHPSSSNASPPLTSRTESSETRTKSPLSLLGLGNLFNKGTPSKAPVQARKYEVTLQTSHIADAGSNAQMSMSLVGTLARSRDIPLMNTPAQLNSGQVRGACLHAAPRSSILHSILQHAPFEATKAVFDLCKCLHLDVRKTLPPAVNA